MEDQIEALERSADITGGGQINLANLTDGLRAEREQGITIDVAYRYFATPRRKFIIADTPGPRAIHAQHGHRRLHRQPLHRARGRAPGRHRAKPPPHLHRLAAAHPAPRHRRQQDGPGGLERGALHRNPRRVRGVPAAPRHQGREVHPAQRAQRRQRRRALPAHALVSRARRCWATWKPSTSRSDWNLNGFRLPVQWVNRPNNPTDPELHDFRGFSGQIAGGIVRVGQKVMVLPSGLVSTVKEIWTYDGPLPGGLLPAIRHPGARGRHRHQPRRHDHRPGQPARRQHRPAAPKSAGCTRARCSAAGSISSGTPRRPSRPSSPSIEDRINMTTFEPEPDPAELALNDIGEIRLQHLRAAGLRRLQHQPPDRLVHPDRAGHQRHRRRRHALPAHGSREAGIQRLRDLTHGLHECQRHRLPGGRRPRRRRAVHPARRGAARAAPRW